MIFTSWALMLNIVPRCDTLSVYGEVPLVGVVLCGIG